MKMKKFLTAALFVAATMAASAQSINVSSAFQNMRKNYLNKAKAEIDAACLHDATKEDAKTWCYKALIYARIGGEASNKKSKFKDLAPDWAEQAYTAALECKRLDKDNEFAQQVSEVFSFVGNEYYNQSTAAYRAKEYAKAIELSDKSVTCFTNAGKSQYAVDAMYIAGISSQAVHDTAGVKKYFNNMVRRKTDINHVYVTLFSIAKAEGKSDEAMKVASNYVRNCKNDYQAYILNAEGYFLSKNPEKGKEQVQAALNLTKDSANYPAVLVIAGTLLDEAAGDAEAAEAYFKQSLALVPSQFEANFGMGKMYYNRAVDKNNAANNIDPFNDESGLYDKLSAESKTLFGQCIEYFEKAVQYYDSLTDEDRKNALRHNLGNCLTAMANAYARVDKLPEAEAAKARLQQLAN